MGKAALLSLFMASGLAAGQTAAHNLDRPSQLQSELDAFLGGYAAAHHAPAEVRYSAALVDLNGDGVLEAVVRLSGDYWCGSGGCILLVLTHRAHGFRLVSVTTISQLPIRLETSRSHGWRDIGVAIGGGGIGYGMAVLHFDGRRYPLNPSMPPAKRVAAAAGRVLIGQADPVRTIPPGSVKRP